jgi:hypothetical protein
VKVKFKHSWSIPKPMTAEPREKFQIPPNTVNDAFQDAFHKFGVASIQIASVGERTDGMDMIYENESPANVLRRQAPVPREDFLERLVSAVDDYKVRMARHVDRWRFYEQFWGLATPEQPLYERASFPIGHAPE